MKIVTKIVSNAVLLASLVTATAFGVSNIPQKNVSIKKTEPTQTATTFKNYGFDVTPNPSLWPASMFKAAILYHIKSQYNKDIKAPFPFERDNPFKEYLKNPNQFGDEYFLKVLLPYVLMAHREHAVARSFLTTENLDEAIKNSMLQQMNIAKKERISHDIEIADALLKNNEKTPEFFHDLERFVEILDVAKYASEPWKGYYDRKKENLPLDDQKNWKYKQKGVYKVLEATKPETVLDVGANIGWFSGLAASLGARVVAVDVDESSVDEMYVSTNNKKTNILPIRFTFEALMKQDDVASKFKSDAVMCLALVHHLTFAAKLDLEKTFDTLAFLAKKTLIIEYVEANYSPAKKNPNYNIQTFKKLGEKYFKNSEVLTSNPGERKLIVFTDKK